jgi:YidC/Oxa1 family membrane protein insertase
VLASSPFDPLYNAIGWLLAFFYKLPPHSLGVSIILMTLIVMAIQFPLIAKQTRSMIQMQRVQPEIKKIQQKYKDDRQKQNEELLKFYQENKINPLAGCLPMLLIIPIGFAVFGTFRDPGIQAHIPRTGTFSQLYVDLCTYDGRVLPPDTPIPPDATAEQEAALNRDSCEWRIDENPPEAMHFLGMVLNKSTAQAMRDEGVVYALPWILVLALVVFTGWYQVRQTQARQLRQGSPINKQMQTITRIMPVFFGFISYGLNAATTVYFAVSNLWRIGQQHFVLNKMYEEEHPGFKGAVSEKSEKTEKTEKSDKSDKSDKPGNVNKDAGKPERRVEGAKPRQEPPRTTQPQRRAGTGSGNGAGAKHPASSAARRKKKRKR